MVKRLSDEQWMDWLFADSVPNLDAKASILKWAPENMKVIGSVRTERWDISTTPWFKRVYEAIDDPFCRSVTLVSIAQSGKSVVGETYLCHRIATKESGEFQYNWENTEKGLKRWKKRVRRIFESCHPVAKMMPSGVTDTNPVVAFPNVNFTMQGIFSSAALESESVTDQVNEELHAWEAGRKKLADKRLQAVEESFQLNISTGGVKGDQLDVTFDASSKSRWLEPCGNPECGEFQSWHVKANDLKLGGLKYKTVKNEDGTYDFDAIAKTIYYECKHCGHKHLDDEDERKERSLRGKYDLEVIPTHAGFTFEAVSVYWIKWSEIIKEKLEALQALRRGDKKPWIVYIQRVEGGFYDPRDRPHIEGIKKNKGVSLNQGLEDRVIRVMTVDKQRGKVMAGEISHYWIIIRDWVDPLKSRLVWEGKIYDDEDVEGLRIDYGIEPRYTWVDSGDDTKRVYQLCAKYGYVAIKGGKQNSWKHLVPDGKGGTRPVRRDYAPVQFIDPFIGTHEAGRQTIPFVMYGKQSIRDTLDLIRAGSNGGWEVPEDVSENYKAHMVSEELEEQQQKDGSTQMVWIQYAPRNDLFVCECYQTLVITLAGLGMPTTL